MRNGTRPRRDHPRSRGGNLLPLRLMVSGLGPSPLARGKRYSAISSRMPLGTIPARAGETSSVVLPDGRFTDHPRSRGGNKSIHFSVYSPPGPSPLARGKRAGQHLPEAARGTIPARAGETSAHRHHAGCARDHPRSRGGNTSYMFSLYAGPGPSPLARGKHSRRPEYKGCRGTIPARAGETCPAYSAPGSAGDHPRSRGGNLVPKIGGGRYPGPSPLARGKRKRCRPACV